METNLFLTCIVAIVDEKTGEMIYSNASHMDPFLINKNSEYQKSDIIPLIEGKGPRLGHEKDSHYPEEKIQLKADDTLVFMTDGIIESTNEEGKQYGQRKFINSLCSHLPKTTIEVKKSLVKDLEEYCNETPFEDDVSLIVMRTIN